MLCIILHRVVPNNSPTHREGGLPGPGPRGVQLPDSAGQGDPGQEAAGSDGKPGVRDARRHHPRQQHAGKQFPIEQEEDEVYYGMFHSH